MAKKAKQHGCDDVNSAVVSNKELAAMRGLVESLDGLTEEECKHVLGWACKRILNSDNQPPAPVIIREWFPWYVQPWTPQTPWFKVTWQDGTNTTTTLFDASTALSGSTAEFLSVSG
jgi:hypothetical protein